MLRCCSACCITAHVRIVGPGNRPPAYVVPKGRWMYEDLRRCAVYFDVPLRQPADFFGVISRGACMRTAVAQWKWRWLLSLLVTMQRP
jgi:hypothetical protein